MWAMANDGHIKTFEELSIGDCRWPLGEAELEDERPGSATLFCAAPASSRLISGGMTCPYCDAHASLAYWKPDAMQQSKWLGGALFRASQDYRQPCAV